jgi:hypothetical protein
MSEALRLSFTVKSSSLLTAPSRSVRVSGLTSPGKREAMALPSTLPSVQRAKLRTTSSAVKGSPLFQVTPWRTLRTYSVASALASQLSSRRPSKVPSLLYWIRYSSQPR